MDLIAKLSVVERVNPETLKDSIDIFLDTDEPILLAYKHVRDKVFFTDRKLIVVDVQGVTGKKVSYQVYPYSKINAYAVETAGTFDMDHDFKIWVSGVGVFEIKFGKRIDIKEIGALLSNKVV